MPFIPNTPEFSVKLQWPEAIKHPRFNDFIPVEWYVNQRVDRKFFYAILFEISPQYVNALIEDSAAQRLARKKAKEPKPEHTLKLCKFFAERLTQIHYQSRKYLS